MQARPLHTEIEPRMNAVFTGVPHTTSGATLTPSIDVMSKQPATICKLP